MELIILISAVGVEENPEYRFGTFSAVIFKMTRCQGLVAFIDRVIKVKGTSSLALKRFALSDDYLLRIIERNS